MQQQEGGSGTAMTQADGDFVGFYRFELESIEHDTLDATLFMRGEDLKVSCDPFPLVIDHSQYVLAGVDVQRLLVKSVRFAKVSAVDMPVEPGIAAARNGFKYRASTLSVELARDEYTGIDVGIQQRQGTARAGLRSLTIRAQRRQWAVLGMRAPVVVLLGRRQHEPRGV